MRLRELAKRFAAWIEKHTKHARLEREVTDLSARLTVARLEVDSLYAERRSLMRELARERAAKKPSGGAVQVSDKAMKVLRLAFNEGATKAEAESAWLKAKSMVDLSTFTSGGAAQSFEGFETVHYNVTLTYSCVDAYFATLSDFDDKLFYRLKVKEGGASLSDGFKFDITIKVPTGREQQLHAQLERLFAYFNKKK